MLRTMRAGVAAVPNMTKGKHKGGDPAPLVDLSLPPPSLAAQLPYCMPNLHACIPVCRPNQPPSSLLPVTRPGMVRKRQDAGAVAFSMHAWQHFMPALYVSLSPQICRYASHASRNAVSIATRPLVWRM
eukprot:365347-Chlamydomonas_euryale.AAC.9